MACLETSEGLSVIENHPFVVKKGRKRIQVSGLNILI